MDDAGFWRKRGKDCSSYEPGLYTWQEISQMVYNEGYIPVANATELDNIRTGASETMGEGTCWEGTYTTGSNKKYVQVLDIDFDGVSYSAIKTEGIGSCYDGNELALKNITTTSGVFTATPGGAAEVQNIVNVRVLNLKSTVYLSAFNSYFHEGLIDNCIIEGTHSGGLHSSGVAYIGTPHGNTKISNTKFIGSVNGTQHVGGFVGIISPNDYTCTIENCSFIGSVNGTQHVGGFVGIISPNSYTCTIENCSFIGSVYASSIDVGGLVGRGESYVIKNCFVNADLESLLRNVGGIIGQTIGTGGLIENCNTSGTYKTGDSFGRAGGIIGFNTSGNKTEIKNSLFTGELFGNNRGGLCAFTNSVAPVVNDSYWDKTVSGVTTTVGGGSGETTTDLQTPTSNTGIYANWDPLIWDFGTSSDYPKLTTTP